jgi:Dihydrodipicolinate synthase/N-acetylneuraminate lyase
LDELGNIVAIKDSSGDDRFFSQVLTMKPELKMSVLQGVENKLLQSKGCDGYMISLSNVEPSLCRNMLDNPSISLNNEILRKFTTSTISEASGTSPSRPSSMDAAYYARPSR